MVEIMKSESLAVVTLSKTRMKGIGEKVLRGKEKGRHGVGIIISTELAPYMESVESVSERIICISIKTKTYAISLIQVCAPQRGRPFQEKDQFYQDLQDATDRS